VKSYPTDQEIQAAGKSSHQLVIDIFVDDISHLGWDKIGAMLWRLKDFRHWADYQGYGTYLFTNTNEVKERIDLAEEIIKRIDSLERHVSEGN